MKTIKLIAALLFLFVGTSFGGPLGSTHGSTSVVVMANSGSSGPACSDYGSPGKSESFLANPESKEKELQGANCSGIGVGSEWTDVGSKGLNLNTNLNLTGSLFTSFVVQKDEDVDITGASLTKEWIGFLNIPDQNYPSFTMTNSGLIPNSGAESSTPILQTNVTVATATGSPTTPVQSECAFLKNATTGMDIAYSPHLVSTSFTTATQSGDNIPVPISPTSTTTGSTATATIPIQKNQDVGWNAIAITVAITALPESITDVGWNSTSTNAAGTGNNQSMMLKMEKDKDVGNYFSQNILAFISIAPSGFITESINQC